MHYFNSYRKFLLVFGFVLMSFSYIHANALTSLHATIQDVNNSSVDTSPDNYINNIFVNLTLSTNPNNDISAPRNLEGLIKSYCASILVNDTTHGNPSTTFLFSPYQSAFVYLLCKNIDLNNSSLFTDKIENFATYFKESDFAKLDLPVKNDQQYLSYLYVDDLFGSLIKEYFTIKQADIYGFQTDDEAKTPIETQINLFSSAYFQDIKICEKSQNLGKHFPKTCTYMTQYLRNQKKMFKDINILSVSGMHNDYAPITTTACSITAKKDSSYNIILCGLWGDPTAKSLSPFVNLIYNELFYYNLFIEYYALQVTKNPNLFYDEATMAGAGTISAQQASYINEMKIELAFAKDALKVGMRMLRNAYVTFPIHIGFLMYRESLQDFGQAIAKIATPMYTLFGEGGKFRKVQCLSQ